MMSDELPTLDVRPTDRDRIPPGQSETRKWPVLHYGGVPVVKPTEWQFEFRGLCDAPQREVNRLALRPETVRQWIYCRDRPRGGGNLLLELAS